MPRGDCSGLGDGGIGACYICWLVGLIAVVVMLSVIVKFVGMLQIWLTHVVQVAHNYTRGITTLVILLLELINCTN